MSMVNLFFLTGNFLHPLTPSIMLHLARAVSDHFISNEKGTYARVPNTEPWLPRGLAGRGAGEKTVSTVLAGGVWTKLCFCFRLLFPISLLICLFWKKRLSNRKQNNSHFDPKNS